MTEQEKAARMVNEALKGYKADPDKFDSYIEWRQSNPTGTYSDYCLTMAIFGEPPAPTADNGSDGVDDDPFVIWSSAGEAELYA